MGSIVFSRVGIISQHLNNIWLFKRVMQPNSPVAGAIRYDEETSYFVTARVHRTWAFLVGSAFCFAPNEWLLGGVIGTFGLWGKTCWWGKRLKRRQPTATDDGESRVRLKG